MKHRNRKAGIVAGAALMAAAWTIPCQASPFVTFSLQARVVGSGSAFSSTVVINPSGASIEYQLLVDMAPTGTINIQGATTRTITSLTVGTDGLNSHKIDIFELASESPQVNFTTPGTLNGDPSPVAGDSWSGSAGTNGGTPVARTGGVGNDLIAVRPAHASGVFTAVDPELMMSGTFVAAPAADNSLLRMRFSTTSPSGSIKINGDTMIFLNTSSELGSDPLTSYVPLEVHASPEPGSLSLLAMGAIGLLAQRRS